MLKSFLIMKMESLVSNNPYFKRLLNSFSITLGNTIIRGTK